MSASDSFTRLALYGPPAGVAVLGLLVGILIQRGLLPRVAALVRRSSWPIADELMSAVRWPLVLWCFLVGARAAARMLPIGVRGDASIGTALLAIAILSVTWAAARLAGDVVHGGVTRRGLTGASLLATTARLVVGLVGVLVLLQTFGVQIGPVLATLGVGGLAVGLALQDTLANVFAGIRILAARKIRPGDAVRLETGQEGTVEDIGWGQTTIRQAGGDIVIVPNNRLATSITTRLAAGGTSPARAPSR